MKTERLTPRDVRLLMAVVIVVAVSLSYARLNFWRAFPEASIELRYSREEITERARAFLAGRGLNPAEYRNVTVFDADDMSRVYLERELGLEEANRWMAGPVPVWRWRARWFRPPEREERIVWMSPVGNIVGFRHILPEAAAGARLTREEALAIAERFLRERTGDPHKLIEQQRQERPNRLDYVFTWERTGFQVKSATYRRTITVQGREVGEYREGLHVPEQWLREYAALRSRNELFSTIANSLYVPLVLAAAAVVIAAVRRRALQWRGVMVVAGAVGLLMVLNEWNSLEFAIDNMPTSATFLEMISLGILQGMGAGVLVYFYAGSGAAAGESLYREQNRDKLSLRQAFSRQGVRTKEFFLATVVGYGMAAFHIAFVVAFYVVAQKFGAWSPQDVQYSDLLSTWAPWLYPLAVALMASTSEEFWFRLFGVSLLRRYVKWRWVAVVIPAFVWGFLHSNYPQQPAWIRGVEVGLIGVVAGFVMLRFGILATLVWHYTVDAVLIGMFLFSAPSLYFRVSGWIVGGVLLIPLAASLAMYWRRGGFLVVTQEEPPAVEEPGAAEEHPVEAVEEFRPPWSGVRLKWAASGALVLGVVAAPVPLGNFLSVRLTREEARRIADEAMRQRGQDVPRWMAVTEYITNLRAPEFEYLRQQVGRREANRVIRDWTQTGVWRTNYFRPLEKEEWGVYVDQGGKVMRTDHQLAENAAGANLGQDEARKRVEAYVAAHGVALDGYRLVDAQTERREKRTDHGFVWESKEFRVGEARARVSAKAVGEEVSEFRRFLKLPEQWLREYERPRLRSFLLPGTLGMLVVPLLVVFLRRVAGYGTPKHVFHWRVYGWLGAAGAVSFVLAVLNQWPTLLADYSTDTPMENFVAGAAASRLIFTLLVGAGFFLGAMALDVFLQGAMGRVVAGPVEAWHPVAAALLLWGAGRTLAWLGQLVPGPRYGEGAWDLPGAEAVAPAFSVLQQAFVGGVARTLLLGSLVAALFGFVGPRRRLPVLAGLLVLISLGEPTVAQALFLLASNGVWVGVVLLLLRTCGPVPVTYAVALFWLGVVDGCGILLRQEAWWYRVNGAAGILAAAAVGWWLVKRRLNERRESV